MRPRTADDDREQEHVGERVGEVGRDRGGRPARGLEHHTEDDGAGNRGERECADDPVEPEAGAEVGHAVSHEQDQTGVDRRVERQPEAVRDRGIRRLFEVGEREQPVEVADRPERDAGSDEQPRRPFSRANQRAYATGAGGDEERRVVDDVVPGGLLRQGDQNGDRGDRRENDREGNRSSTIGNEKPHAAVIGSGEQRRDYPFG